MQGLATLSQQAEQEINSAANIDMLEQVRVKFLGKTGHITLLLKDLGKLPVDDRPSAGAAVNKVKQDLQNLIKQRKQLLTDELSKRKLAAENIDITLPARGTKIGKLHPISQVFARINDFFTGLGFTIAEGPEIEDEYYNFEALNIPSYHPARAMQDTFYLPGGKLLRTHTSPVQIRSMLNNNPPFRLIAPGRVYRCDSDLTHTPMFHQVEGLMIDKGISFSHLKGVLTEFLQYFFQKQLSLRFRPSYFPFTEPSAEVDITCTNCGGKGCRICGNTGWIEILGCGMVHPKVLENCRVCCEEYSGWAFGIGVDRLAMLYFNIPDLRMMFENDIKFLEQF